MGLVNVLTKKPFKIKGLAKKLVNMLCKKAFKINDLAARGPSERARLAHENKS